MDHLPQPIDGSLVQAPFYVKPFETYTPDQFFTLPARYDYNNFAELLENGLRPDMDLKVAHEFLQSWLFFALLSRVLGRDIETKEFYHQSHHALHTHTLRGLLQDWAHAEENSWAIGPRSDAENRYITASMALECARKFVVKHCSYERMDRQDRLDICEGSRENPVHKNLNQSLTLSLAVLGETLQNERPEMVKALDDRVAFSKDPRVEETSWGYSKHTRKELLKRRCPFDVRRIESILDSVSTLYVASTIQRNKSDPDRHSRCSKFACNAEPLQQDVMHIPDFCKKVSGHECQLFNRSFEDQLQPLIESGKIPLVIFNYQSGIDLRPYDPTTEQIKFGALSHTWTEHILNAGNDLRGGNNRFMYSCQIEALQAAFNLLIAGEKDPNQHVPFWVDALCLPRNHTVKRLAINQMKDIYKKAEAVLIWDRDLIQRAKGDDLIEFNLRIRTGEWSQRLWTLQETVLATNLYIACAKMKFISLEDLRTARDRARENYEDQYHFIWKAGHPFSQTVWHLRGTKEDKVQRAWEVAQFRSISYPEDETIILANILGLDVVQLQDIVPCSPKETASKRMIHFLNMLDKTPGLGIPSGLIFLPPTERIEETKGYEWAPRTWTTMQPHSYALFRPIRKAGSLMRHGLQVEFPAILLHCATAPIEKPKFWIPVHQSMHKWFKVVADTDKVEWTVLRKSICEGLKPSIITSTHKLQERWEIGVLVTEKGVLTRGEVHWVKVLCKVWVRMETNPIIIQQLMQSFREHQDWMLFGERLPTQKWCIDGGRY